MIKISKSDRLFVLIEIVGFVAFALILKQIFDGIIWRFAGPISLFITIALLSVYMQKRGLRWSEMGLPSLHGLKAKLMLIPQIVLVLVVFGASVMGVIKGGEALGFEFMTEIPEGVEDRWGAVEGNLPMLLLWLGIIWTSAAFFEEMFFRGFLITRLQVLFRGLPIASILSVLLPALLFGYGHMYYQGLRGFFVTGVIGLVFGTLFLLYKRNLWPMILFHGLIDSAGFIALYFGADI